MKLPGQSSSDLSVLQLKYMVARSYSQLAAACKGSITGYINPLRVGSVPSSRWTTHSYLSGIFVEFFFFLSHIAFSCWSFACIANYGFWFYGFMVCVCVSWGFYFIFILLCLFLFAYLFSKNQEGMESDEWGGGRIWEDLEEGNHKNIFIFDLLEKKYLSPIKKKHTKI